jgi:hypothetical protein
MTTHRRGSREQDRHPADLLAAEITDVLQAQDSNASAPGAVTWTRAQLQKRSRQAGAAVLPAADPAHPQQREPDREPLADREAEP